MSKRLLTGSEELEDLAYGLIFLGTGGGGGTTKTTVDLLSQELEAGRSIEVVRSVALPEDSWTVTVAGMGARSTTKPSAEELSALGLTEERFSWLDRLAAAVEEMARYTGQQIGAIVPAEMGCFNTAAPMAVAARLGIPTIDGDYAGGRAVPEVEQMIPDLCGIPIYPMAFVDRWGDVCILKESRSSAMADRLGRMLCAASYEGVGVAWYPLQVRRVRTLMADGSLSKAIEIGRARRMALQARQDPLQAVVESVNGRLLFKGEVIEGEKAKTPEAFMFNTGIHHLKGIEEFSGDQLDIWYKNESHVCWKNAKPFVTSPDLISIVDLVTGAAKVTYDVVPGQRVAVIGLAANPAHRTERGIHVLGPRHFGFNFDYAPIEKIVD